MTGREKDIFPLLADGYTNSEIAEKFDISHKTVKNMLQVSRRRHKAKNTIHMIAKWLRGELNNED